MATYKKRGYKPKAVKEQVDKEAEIAAEEMESTTAEVFNTLDETAGKTEEWVAENQKYIFIGVAVLALFALVYIGFDKFVRQPKEATAANEMYQAQKFFKLAEQAEATQKDSLYNLALNGGEGKLGLLEVVDEYGSTNTGNIANYYAGFALLKTGKYKEAITALEKFSSKDPILEALSYGGIADSFAQLKNYDEALKFYQKASEVEENDFTTPKFLLKLAKLAIDQGKPSIAVSSLEKIKKEFVKSTAFSEVEGLLARAKAIK